MASLEIFFYDLKFSNLNYDSFLILGKEYIIGNETIKIQLDDNLFDKTKNPRITEIQLFNKSNEDLSALFYFNLYYGDNVINVFTACGGGITYELILKKTNIKSIFFHNKEIKHYDTLGTENRKRFTLINFIFEIIQIDNISINLFIYRQKLSNSKNYQYSVFDIKQKLIVVKPIEFYKNTIFKLFKFKEQLNHFYETLKEFLKDSNHLNLDDIIISNYQNINSIYINKLNISKDKLENIFNDKQTVELFYYKKLVDLIYDYEEISENKKINIKDAFDYFENIKENILEDKSLKYYQQVFLLENYFSIYEQQKDITLIKKLNIKYYLTNKAEEDSILSITFKFFNQIINMITEKSKIFFPLLQINSGEGYYKQDKVYSFNMINVQTLKLHLKEIIPDIIMSYTKEGKKIASTHKFTGLISINSKKIFNHESLDFIFKKSMNLSEAKDNSIILFRYIFHELCHKKYTFENTDKEIYSPKKFFNEENKLITLLYYQSKTKEENISKLLTSNLENIGDSGHFLEYFFGNVLNRNFFMIFDKTKNLGKLIDNPDLFLDDLNVIKEYIKLKYISQTISKTIHNQNLSIYDEMKQLEINIKLSESQLNLNKNNENDYLKKKINNITNKEELDEIRKKIKFDDNESNIKESENDKDINSDEEIENNEEKKSLEEYLIIMEKLENENTSLDEWRYYRRKLSKYLFTD